MDLLSDVGKLINNRGSRGTPRDGVERLKEKLAELEKENDDLRREVSRLRMENEAVTAMMARMLSARSNRRAVREPVGSR